MGCPGQFLVQLQFENRAHPRTGRYGLVVLERVTQRLAPHVVERRVPNPAPHLWWLSSPPISGPALDRSP